MCQVRSLFGNGTDFTANLPLVKYSMKIKKIEHGLENKENVEEKERTESTAAAKDCLNSRNPVMGRSHQFEKHCFTACSSYKRAIATVHSF